MNEIEINQVQTEALTIREQAKSIMIVDKESYESAGLLLLAVKKLRKQIKEVFAPMKAKAMAAHKEIVAQEKKADAEAAETETILIPAMTAYDEKYGARPLRRAVEHYLEDPLAEAVLRGAIKEGEPILVVREGDKLEFRQKEPATGATGRNKRPCWFAMKSTTSV